MSPRVFPFVASLALLGVVWHVAAMVTADPTVLPTPAEVARLMWAETVDGPLLHHMTMTLGRVVAAFAIAMGVGTALGLAMGRSRKADLWLGPWVTVFLNIPALVVIVLCYLWIGLNELAAILAVSINKTAMVAVMVREGTRALDPALDDLSTAYRMPRWTRARHVIWPQLQPHMFAAMRNGVAIIWKIVLVVEFLGRPNGIGFQIHLYFQLFETGYVLAYAFSFVALMLVVEYALFARWEKRSTAWRRLAV
ncbi:MAG: ABC transporter permease [Pseudomonadota bacterium]